MARGPAQERFSQPSFQATDTLPRTDEPLQYLFLRDKYKKARWVYVAAVVAVYLVFVIFPTAQAFRVTVTVTAR